MQYLSAWYLMSSNAPAIVKTQKALILARLKIEHCSFVNVVQSCEFHEVG